MKRLIFKIKGIAYRVFNMICITAPGCKIVPVYLVEDVRVKVVHRGNTIPEDE